MNPYTMRLALGVVTITVFLGILLLLNSFLFRVMRCQQRETAPCQICGEQGMWRRIVRGRRRWDFGLRD